MSNLKVVQSPETNSDLANLKIACQVMDNKIQVISAQVGFELKSADMKQDTEIPSYAQAHDKMGFETIGELISALNIEWNDWEKEVKAYEIRNRFNISVTDDETVITQYNDVCKYLGREPYNAQDFHKYKDEMFNNVITQLKSKHNTLEYSHKVEVDEYEKKITAMSDKYTLAESKLTLLESEKSDLEKQQVKMAVSHEKELKVQREIAIGDKEEALTIQKNQLSAEFEVKLSMQISELNKEIEASKAEISLLKSQMDTLIHESKAELEAAIEKHTAEISLLETESKKNISDNYVPRFDYQAALMKLDQESNAVMRLLSSEQEFTFEKEKMQSAIDELSISVTNYKKSYDNLNDKVLSGEITHDDLDIEKITSILNSHNSIVEKLGKYKEAAFKRGKSIETKNNQLRKKDKKISKLKTEVEKNKESVGKSKAYAWLLGLSAVGTATLATLSMTGMI